MNDDTTIDPDLVRQHADFVGRIADRAQQARDASEAIRLGSHSYGLLCQALPAMMSPTHDDFNTKLDELKTAFTDTADHLRDAATDLETLDFGNSQDLEDLRPA